MINWTCWTQSRKHLKIGITLLGMLAGIQFCGTVMAQDYELGFKAFEREDYATALQEWLPLAEKGEARAQFNLGLMNYYGLGVPQDLDEALRWYHLAADQGPVAKFDLARMYYNGEGVPQDFDKAAKWYRLAALQGIVEAQYNLGFMYFNGEGVPQDYSKAEWWFKLAAERGFAQAQVYLGFMYFSGAGVQSDFVLSHAWYHLASEEGHEKALEYRDVTSLLLTPEQISKAQFLASNWKEGYESSENNVVPLIQQALKILGYVPGPVDGHMGPQTREAIMKFQVDNELPIDGKVTSNFREELLMAIENLQ